ncbi:DNA-binding GntR family transcriptional regulator [Palleronia aestuarii]|uniref:DNA-binding GntR family transcriptional regulator n=1 Tax=Palleronia aestuarii TaxID=568105 RepID=A0A2W7NAZ8_9RHOB|nr:GntR family transcriptional regulator [Palleronia aestuarii]PZX17170.1 DNA-binding GntR family transcriptional regulator [Palleronia aestuarii]
MDKSLGMHPAQKIGEPRIPSESARERAYRGIRAGIIAGDFAPGEFIEEATACEATGVSRSPVREALNRLAAEGFVELHPRRGALVKPLSAEELRDLFEVRSIIERHAVSRICRESRPVPDDLLEICRRHEALDPTDLPACVEINRLFHRQVIAASGNQVLLQVFDSLRASLTRVAMLSLQLGVGKNDIIESEHRELVEALQAQDEAAALDVLDRHLQPMPKLMAALR